MMANCVWHKKRDATIAIDALGLALLLGLLALEAFRQIHLIHGLRRN